MLKVTGAKLTIEVGSKSQTCLLVNFVFWLLQVTDAEGTPV